ncbi:helix-turn-helix domain-containing protein [Streptomyces sp. NPDC090493]|uniref:helix-turn-helix domain-containing protein n=1 Tax=Streptomyces sp. NPDC090493 TaxID=3365964 RepID=UPI00380947E5
MESLAYRPGYVTAHQAAEILDVGLGTIRQMVRRGQLHHAGGTPRQPWYPAEEVNALAAKRRDRAAA